MHSTSWRFHWTIRKRVVTFDMWLLIQERWRDCRQTSSFNTKLMHLWNYLNASSTVVVTVSQKTNCQQNYSDKSVFHGGFNNDASDVIRVLLTTMAAVCGTSMRWTSSWNICVGWQWISHGSGALPFDALSTAWPVIKCALRDVIKTKALSGGLLRATEIGFNIASQLWECTRLYWRMASLFCCQLAFHLYCRFVVTKRHIIWVDQY